MSGFELFWRGLIAGLTIAAPLGPVNVLCIQRTLTRGWRSGVRCGVGAAAGDTVYGAIAGFSIQFVIGPLLREQSRVRLVAGILLVAIGASYWLRRSRPFGAAPRRPQVSSDVVSTLLLNLTNPTVVLSFLAVLATLGLGGTRHWSLTVWLIGGIFSGSMLWWILLTVLVNRLRGRLGSGMAVWMNRAAGLAIGSFGASLIVLSRFGA